MTFFKNFFNGLILGASNMFPGMSAGTMAVVLGIYDKLIGSISGLFKKFRENIVYLIPVGLGMVIGIASFAKFFDWALVRFPVQCYAVFAGLVLGSLPLIWKIAKKSGGERVGPSCIISLAVALGIMIATSMISPPEAAPAADFNFGFALYMFFFTAVAATAMIIPGLSGSYIMLLVGIYATIISGISEFLSFVTGRGAELFRIAYLIPVALGCLVGFFAGAKLIRFVLDRFPKETYFAILGLMAGSIFGLVVACIGGWPDTGSAAVTVITSLVTLAAGTSLTLIISRRV